MIAALSIIGCSGLLQLLDSGHLDGSAANLAASQRTASQQVALHASSLAHRNLTAVERREREALLEAEIRDMRSTLAELAGSPEDPDLSDRLRQHYFAEPTALSRRTVEYLDVADAALAASREHDAVGAPVVDLLLHRSETLLPLLHEAVELSESSTRERLDGLNYIFVAVLFVQLGMLWLMWSLVLRPTAEHLAKRETAQQEENDERDRRAASDRFVTKLQHGLENVDNEEDVLRLAQRAFGQVESAESVELLLADSSEAHLRRAAASHPETAGCTVGMPFECPAVRNGRTSIFSSSTELDACPRLAELPERCSALCVPVNFMGRALGVLRATGEEHTPPDRHRLRVIGGLVGSRLGSIRAFNQVLLQASTDSLTGLLNRRAIEEAVHRLRRSATSFAVSVLDLDEFKLLNDTHGHEAGDRALTIFAKCLRETVDSRGIVGRFGGEEFVVVLPEVSRADAVELLDTARERLAQVLASSNVPAFTVSGGVSDTTLSDEYDELIDLADAALYFAKRTGRDRIVTHDEAVALSTQSDPSGPTAKAPLYGVPRLSLTADSSAVRFSRAPREMAIPASKPHG